MAWLAPFPPRLAERVAVVSPLNSQLPAPKEDWVRAFPYAEICEVPEIVCVLGLPLTVLPATVVEDEVVLLVIVTAWVTPVQASTPAAISPAGVMFIGEVRGE